MAFSAARSAAVTGSKPPGFLFSTASAVRKNGRMVSPETLASWSTKLAKSMAVMACSARRLLRRLDLSDAAGCRQLEPGASHA